MKFERIVDFATNERKYILTLTDRDYLNIWKDLDGHDRYLLEFFGREGGTIEEKLMGLQILARKVEEYEERIRTQQQRIAPTG